MFFGDLASTLVATKQTQGEPSLSGASEDGVADWAKTALDLWGQGANLYHATVDGNGKTTPVVATTPASSFKQYLPWIIGGGLLLVVAVIFFRRS